MTAAELIQPSDSDDPVFFFDRDVGIFLPQRLRDLGLPTRVEIHQEHFAQTAEDDLWMAEVGSRGWIVIGHDRHHHTRPLERQAIQDHGIGCFYLWGGDQPGHEKMRCFLSAYDRMIEAVSVTPRPFVYRVLRNGGLRKVDLEA